MNKNMLNEKRKNERIEYRVTIQCSKIISEGQVNTLDSPLEMNVENIAPEGLCISSLEAFKEGSMFKFDIMLENILYQGITGTIIWRTNDDNTYYYGLHIQNITGRFGVHIIEIGRKIFKKI